MVRGDILSAFSIKTGLAAKLPRTNCKGSAPGMPPVQGMPDMQWLRALGVQPSG